VFEQIWESSTPSKIIVFSWHLLYDRIPTRSNLIYRGIISPEEHMDCVGILESSSDLFLNCPSAMLVWYCNSPFFQGQKRQYIYIFFFLN
jgi:hypothetical protein